MIEYPLASTTWDEAEYDAIAEVVASGNFTMGRKVQEFENKFARFFGAKYAVMSNSGSSANLLAVAAHRYRKNSNFSSGQEIIVPAVSWGTTYYPVHQLGYTLRFVDIDPQTLNAHPDSIKAAINENTAGIFAVNLLGNPSQLQDLVEIAGDSDIFLIEDNCESMGAKLGEKFTGSFGSIGTFSSFFSHHISTMEGGMCITDDLELAQLMISLRAHGWLRNLPEENLVWPKTGDDFEDSFRFVLPGYNLRPLELSGAIGISQLEKLPALVENRRQNASTFIEQMEGVSGFRVQVETGESSWFGFSLVLCGKNSGRRSELISTLSAQGVECRPIVAGNFTRNPVLRHLDHAPLATYPVADELHSNGLFIGNHHYPLETEIVEIVDLLRNF